MLIKLWVSDQRQEPLNRHRLSSAAPVIQPTETMRHDSGFTLRLLYCTVLYCTAQAFRCYPCFAQGSSTKIKQPFLAAVPWRNGLTPLSVASFSPRCAAGLQPPALPRVSLSYDAGLGLKASNSHGRFLIPVPAGYGGECTVSSCENTCLCT